jgi:DNA mismatch endonuclease, patch repair protein
MSRIRGRDTGPELLFRRALWARGLRYRLHARELQGRPDLVFPRPRVAVFIDGCQWHGCPEHYVRPRSNEAFWTAKLAQNVSRDRRQTAQLEAGDWRVIRVWEHDIRRDPKLSAERVISVLRGQEDDHRKTDFRIRLVEIVDPETDLERRHMVELRSGAERAEIRKRTTSKA